MFTHSESLEGSLCGAYARQPARAVLLRRSRFLHGRCLLGLRGHSNPRRRYFLSGLQRVSCSCLGGGCGSFACWLPAMERPGPSEGGFLEAMPGRVGRAGDAGGATLTRPRLYPPLRHLQAQIHRRRTLSLLSPWASRGSVSEFYRHRPVSFHRGLKSRILEGEDELSPLFAPSPTRSPNYWCLSCNFLILPFSSVF